MCNEREDSSDVTKAIRGSRKTEDGKFVGFDVFEITGHVVCGNEVYLTIKETGWVRSLDVLEEYTQ